MNRRGWMGLVSVCLALSGCAGVRTVTCEVSTFGHWPAQRAPGTYAFERLPSQQAQGQDSDQLEAWARPALQAAGFTPAASGAEPEFLVQLGARVTRFDRSPWDDPLWWRGGYSPWRFRPWGGPYWGWGRRAESPRYEREVAVLLRDRRTGEPLYEARASNDGFSEGVSTYLSALFIAAMKDFPAVLPNPHEVSVPLPVGP